MASSITRLSSIKMSLRRLSWKTQPSQKTSEEVVKPCGGESIRYLLPVELWLRIFEILACDPESMDTNGHNPFFASQSCQERRVQNILALPIIKVCQHWRMLATPMLYQYIVVKDESCLDLLLRTFVDCQRRTCLHVNTYVHRLAVSVQLYTSDNADKLSRVLSLLPNLQIMSFPGSISRKWKGLLSPVILTALSACHESIQVLDFSDSATAPHPFDLRRLLSNTPHLRALTLTRESPRDREDAVVPYLRPLILPELYFLSMRYQSSFPLVPGDQFSSLRCFEFKLGHNSDFSLWRRRLSQYGNHVTAVAVHTGPYRVDMQAVVDMLRDTCPHLTHLSIGPGARWNLPQGLRLPCITHFAVLRGGAAGAHAFFQNLLTIQAPDLQMLRLSSAMALQLALWPELYDQIDSRPFQVQDEFGWPLTSTTLLYRTYG
ncbi:hypothetical protein NEOLEDRAFT_1142879 [Neolentinus lepideus HHB14362 ss-1]|uniref:F-box domain-containing protein n=1 Tax=Neolentinus lepideus HHB14362 ss-1 TaxID=1314782 RepID=A0A165MVL3_9AGAM|nr:hypothetical protein NEOLEDRAFT_1142879 [Neolentinus lepideus HHB14362 ss-1]